jgi:hypothetical protein
MNIKVALNMDGITPPQQLARFQTAITKLTGNAVYPDLATALPDAQTAHDAAETKIEQINVAEEALRALRAERDSLMEDVLETYASFGAHVESKCLGNPANVTGAGFDVQSPRSSSAPLGKVENNVLTSGDDPGTLDLACNSMKGARSYEWQTSPNGNDGWVHRVTTTTSRTHLEGFESGQKQWSRVRAINKHGPGPWSDAASAMVP